MGVLSEHGITVVNHYAPLHYLPFIARSGLLLSKPELIRRGYAESHFRAKSRQQDQQRGFGNYVHLTTHPAPPILLAKLAGGFPHFRLEVPVESVEETKFDLCRFNVAMTRRLRRAESSGHLASSTSGRYYGRRQIPVARSHADKRSMLTEAAKCQWMVEVLVKGYLMIPDGAKIVCYSKSDQQQAERILRSVGRAWLVALDDEDGGYTPCPEHVRNVHLFIGSAMNDSGWKGDGLEFDKV